MLIFDLASNAKMSVPFINESIVIKSHFTPGVTLEKVSSFFNSKYIQYRYTGHSLTGPITVQNILFDHKEVLFTNFSNYVNVYLC